jgi:HAD superfamily hydrolase (TIGR01509 family)
MEGLIALSASRVLGQFHAAGFSAVIFDCDGVLADTEPAWAEAEREMCRLYGVDREQEPRVSTQGKAIPESVRVLLPHASPHDRAEAERELIAIAADYVALSVRALPGATEAVQSLAESVPVGVASNSPRAILEAVLEAIGVAPYISHFVAGDDVTSGKPAPDVYLRCCQLLGSSPQESVAFEDSLPGILAARSAGCAVVQVGVPGVPRFPEADHYVETLEEL